MSLGKIIGVIIVIIIIAGLVWYFWLRQSKESKEGLRRQKVAQELKLTYMEPIETDLIAKLKNVPGVSDEEIILYRDGVKKLMEVAPIMKLLYQKQIGADLDARVKAETDDDRELIDRYGHPWCLADTSEECCALPSLPKRTSGVIPPVVSCEDAVKLGGPFETIVRDKEGELTAVPYAKMWPGELGRAAELLREAAEIFSRIPREEMFAAHLEDVADAFESDAPYPFNKSDKSWNELLASDSLFFIRLGPDEVGSGAVGDKCECKARYHFNLGIVSSSAGDIIERVRPAAERFENEFARLINDPQNYMATDVQVQLPIFLDVIYANGDDVGGPNGTPIGQTLPNWCGEDGKAECLRGTMIYVNKTIKAYSDKLIKEYIMPLFAPEVRGFFNAQAGLDSVVYHEMFHNFGPRDKKKKPGSNDTYGQFLVTEAGESWKLPMEELKAQTGSLYMATRFYQDAVERHEKGEMDDAEFAEEVRRFKEHIVYDIAWALRMILRASRSGPEFTSRNPYSRLAAVQIGFLAEKGALDFDPETKEWSINFEKMPDVVGALMKKTGDLYVKSKAKDVEDFFLYYIQGDGEKLLHRDRLVEVAGKMPSVLFEYRLEGL